MKGRTGLIDMGDRWLLPFKGMQVTQLLVSYQLGLRLDVDQAYIDIEQTAMLKSDAPQSTVRLVPERQEVGAALALFCATITSSEVFKSGTLQVSFDTGIHLSVEPHGGYEAWSVEGPGTLRIICMPDGPAIL
ncbi:DUF6188 family protein [Actinoplanes sp. CA-030573]|uniref:DUF6188 family protein n=1 Tax=Actinoplanes sp. CA-030573 TaxID=3239898 RepID=UPI003D90856E